MDTNALDVVYFVKDSPRNDELRYSLRSLVANFPCKRVWIFGGCPKDIVPDVRVRVEQSGRTKWDKVRTMLKMACVNKEITDNFILFNDDFFVMEPTKMVTPKYRCELGKHIEILEAGRSQPSEYSRLLRNCQAELARLGTTQYSYELHLPFAFNKELLLRMLNEHPNFHCARTMYGNLYGIGGEQSSDVKIFSSKPAFDYKKCAFLSTDDSVVNVNNDAWRYIKNSFRKTCRYEEPPTPDRQWGYRSLQRKTN